MPLRASGMPNHTERGQAAQVWRSWRLAFSTKIWARGSHNSMMLPSKAPGES